MTHRDTQGWRPHEDGDRDWSYAATIKECQELPKAGRGKKGFSPRAFRGGITLLAPWFYISGCQNSERKNFSCFKPRSVWEFVTALLGNEYKVCAFLLGKEFIFCLPNILFLLFCNSTPVFLLLVSSERFGVGLTSSPVTWPSDVSGLEVGLLSAQTATQLHKAAFVGGPLITV